MYFIYNINYSSNDLNELKNSSNEQLYLLVIELYVHFNNYSHVVQCAVVRTNNSSNEQYSSNGSSSDWIAPSKASLFPIIWLSIIYRTSIKLSNINLYVFSCEKISPPLPPPLYPCTVLTFAYVCTCLILSEVKYTSC